MKNENDPSKAASLAKILLSGAIGLAACGADAATFYVDAAHGRDTYDGRTPQTAFATPQAARDHLRMLRARRTLPDEKIEVVLSGTFSSTRESALVLQKQDGGMSPDKPVVWRAGRDGAHFNGACRLSPADFKPVTGAARERLRPDVRDKVLVCDLAAHGVAALPPLPDTFNKWTEMELISSGKAMTIARYPNQGWLEITNVIDRGVSPCDRRVSEWEFGTRSAVFEYAGDRPAAWDISKGVYVFGFWCYDWASDSLRIGKVDAAQRRFTLAGIHRYGVGHASKWQQGYPRYYVYNLLEELDAPGEWYVDRAARLLYFYPTAAGLGDVALSLMKKPLVAVHGAKNLRLEGLDFAFSTGWAVQVRDAEDVTLHGLTATWLSQSAMEVAGGARVTVERCRIAQMGSGGLYVRGGNRRTLTKCGHVVRQNDIGHCGRLARISGPCFNFGGCGVTVENNYFHDTPYIAMSYGGNEHLVQYNEIECAMLEAGDGAGIYTGRDWGSRGNVLRWNYLHHFGQAGVDLREQQGRPSGCEALKKGVMVEGIYLDDCDSGETIYGNLFYKAGRAMFTGGGRDNLWRDNLIIDCTAAAHFDTRGLQRARPGSGIKDGWDLLAKIEQFAYTNEPWASRYPQLIGIMRKEPLLPIGTAYENNIAVNCGFFFNAGGHAAKFLQERAPNRGNVSYNPRDLKRDERMAPQTNAVQRAKLEIRMDAAFGAAAERDPKGFQDTAAFKAAFPSFPRIPVERIGLR